MQGNFCDKMRTEMKLLEGYERHPSERKHFNVKTQNTVMTQGNQKQEEEGKGRKGSFFFCAHFSHYFIAAI